MRLDGGPERLHDMHSKRPLPKTARATTDSPALAEAAGDSGRIVRRPPRAIARPTSTAAVADVLQWANETGACVTLRGCGHTQSGQALARTGEVLLDLRRMNRIRNIGLGWAEVEAGATWRQLTEAAAKTGRIPAVLTNNLDTTIGGTLATGGVSLSSYLRGCQVDNVDALDVVTGSGRPDRCSRGRNRALFDAVRGSLGTIGAITGAIVRLRAKAGVIRTERLVYHQLGALLDDLEKLPAERFQYIGGWCRHRVHGDEHRDTDWADGDDWCFPLHLSTEHAARDDERHLGGLRYDRRFEPLVETEDAFANRQEVGPTEARQPPRIICPVTEAFIPWGEAAAGIPAILSALPLPLVAATNIMVRPLGRLGADGERHQPSSAPLLMIPEDTPVVGFGLIPYMPPWPGAFAMPIIEAAGRKMTELGGKRYLTGWIRHSEAEWRSHYGARWRVFNEWKEKFDPNHVLGSGLVPFEKGTERPDEMLNGTLRSIPSGAAHSANTTGGHDAG